MRVVSRTFALMVLPAFLATACATQARYDSSGAYQAYCNTCGTIERIARVRLLSGEASHRLQANLNKSERGFRFEVELDDGRRAQVTQLDRYGLRVGDSVIIRDEEVRLRR